VMSSFGNCLSPVRHRGRSLGESESPSTGQGQRQIARCHAGRTGTPTAQGGMICDTTFLSDLHDEAGRPGPAIAFLAAHRTAPSLVTVISAGEVAVIFDTNQQARQFLARYRILRLLPEIAYVAAGIDRELIGVGQRLSENDNWIAGFCRYYAQPLISRDGAFDRVRGLRRLRY